MSILDSFKLVELITTRTDAVVTIGGGNNIKFNAATHVDLDYPAYIQMFVDSGKRKIHGRFFDGENSDSRWHPAG